MDAGMRKPWKTALSEKCHFSRSRTSQKHTFPEVINFMIFAEGIGNMEMGMIDLLECRDEMINISWK